MLPQGKLSNDILSFPIALSDRYNIHIIAEFFSFSLTQGDAALLVTLYLQGDAERGEVVEVVTQVLMEAASLLGASLNTLSVERFGE